MKDYREEKPIFYCLGEEGDPSDFPYIGLGGKVCREKFDSKERKLVRSTQRGWNYRTIKETAGKMPRNGRAGGGRGDDPKKKNPVRNYSVFSVRAFNLSGVRSTVGFA